MEISLLLYIRISRFDYSITSSLSRVLISIIKAKTIPRTLQSATSLFLPLTAKSEHLIHLGRSFMTSEYLYVDNDHQQFTLWQSPATNAQDIIAASHPKCASVSPPLVSSPSARSPSAMVTTQAKEFQSSTPKNAMTGGKIAGRVPRALAAIMLCCGTIFVALATRRACCQQD